MCLYIWTNERSPLCLPAQHEGPVQGLALIDLLHQQSYHSGLQHHALVTGGASNDRWADFEIYNMLAVTTPALLGHREPAQGTQSSLMLNQSIYISVKPVNTGMGINNREQVLSLSFAAVAGR